MFCNVPIQNSDTKRVWELYAEYDCQTFSFRAIGVFNFCLSKDKSFKTLLLNRFYKQQMEQGTTLRSVYLQWCYG